MTEIENTEEEIKLLQTKLDFLKETEDRKSPEEKAYKRWYGEYPPTTPSVSNSEDERWSAFQQGYHASKEDCKVEEEPKPGTLYNVLRHGLECSIDMCGGVVDAVEEWLPDKIYIEFSGAYERGWNDALRTIKDNLR